MMQEGAVPLESCRSSWGLQDFGSFRQVPRVLLQEGAAIGLLGKGFRIEAPSGRCPKESTGGYTYYPMAACRKDPSCALERTSTS
eukprot:scaffold46696_cov65-Phaeocystis_antarctica.AAC.2